MSDTVIRASGVAKRYRIGEAERYGSLRASLEKLLRPRRSVPDDTIWSLLDVSFEVKQGEVIGIIGRNGAVKSTLLKVLSRITTPTRGRVEIRGRVGCLLEVGTGFHPELSGRDNIFLNGTLLGMKRSEIMRQFDEIVAFAEIEKFIDTPVKHYSSGMYLRLAFAVAAHLQPEILIVDEVLAVGDVSFQRKCLDKMDDVSHQGRTVLFVSHNMPAVTRLCPRTILLDKGRSGRTARLLGWSRTIFEAASARPRSEYGRAKDRETTSSGFAPYVSSTRHAYRAKRSTSENRSASRSSTKYSLAATASFQTWISTMKKACVRSSRMTRPTRRGA